MSRPPLPPFTRETAAQKARMAEDVLVKAEVRVAFISGGRAQPIPRSIRALMKADLIS